MKGAELWNKYCSFFEKSFSDQLDYNTRTMKEYFNLWKQTKTAKQLCTSGPEKIEDAPVTTYSDYPILHEFGRRLDEKISESPRQQDELLSNYFKRICRPISPMLEGYLAGEFSICALTSGSQGANKWVAHCEEFWRNYSLDAMAMLIMACSAEYGETAATSGDKGLNISAPVPYMSGWGLKACEEHFGAVPPPEVADNISDLRKKFYLALELIEKGQKITIGGGVGSLFYTIYKYFIEPESFYEDYRRSLPLGLAKTYMFLKWIGCKLGSRKYTNIKDILPLKGVAISGVDAKLYLDFFKQEFGIEPLNCYGVTELGISMTGLPDRKHALLPNLRSGYYEFLSETGEFKKIDELKKEMVYELIGTPFGSIFIRYSPGDLLRVVDFRDDDMPVFSFEGRKTTIVEIQSYFRLTEDLMTRALAMAGLRSSDKWAVAKITHPKEHLDILMEKEWPYTESQAAKIVFESLQSVCSDFRRYVEDFRVKKPSEVVRVEYLKKGAFLRYAMRQAKKGAPIGQIKPPKLVSANRLETFDLLKRI